MLLALDSSTLTLSLALVERGGAVRAEVAKGPPERASELLPGAVEALLAAQGLRLDALDGFLVGLGPGSFTGLRIGLATVKGLAYALRRPVAGASSLACAALDGPEGVPLAVLAEVRKGELYVGRYLRRGATLESWGAEEPLPVAAVAALLRARPEAVALGPAVRTWGPALQQDGVEAARLLDVAPFPRARHLAPLCALPAAYDAPSLFALEPRYLKGSGAEDNPKFPPLPGPEPAARLKVEE